MVQCVSKYACSCMKNQLVKKIRDRRWAFLDIAAHIQFPQVDICVSVTTRSTFAAFKTHFGCTFYIPTSGNILMQHLGLPGAWISAWHNINFCAISLILI